jgi:lipoprotein-releasing system permease protein
LILGIGVCYAQINYGFVQMPNTGGELFPVILRVKDILFILGTVIVLSTLSSYFPVRYLVRKTIH